MVELVVVELIVVVVLVEVVVVVVVVVVVEEIVAGAGVSFGHKSGLETISPDGHTYIWGDSPTQPELIITNNKRHKKTFFNIFA